MVSSLVRKVIAVEMLLKLIAGGDGYSGTAAIVCVSAMTIIQNLTAILIYEVSIPIRIIISEYALCYRIILKVINLNITFFLEW